MSFHKDALVDSVGNALANAHLKLLFHDRDRVDVFFGYNARKNTIASGPLYGHVMWCEFITKVTVNASDTEYTLRGEVSKNVIKELKEQGANIER